MKRIDPAIVQDIRQRTDIVDVISHFVPLKRAGQNYKGVCPFHQEKTPSFTVHPGKQIFHCFGCQKGGNVFTFLMEYHSQSFWDVVQDLARQAGIPLVFTEEEQGRHQARDTLLRINREAMGFFQWLLAHPEHGEMAQAYLRHRQISPAMQTQFGLGYALNSWNALWRHLSSKGFSEEELQISGLFGQYEKKDGLYDVFRHRLIFPILNIHDEVIAFGGRNLAEDQQAKYINSPETPLYQKGEHLYALNVAKNAVRKKDQVLLMEGYLDVISAHQHGFEQAVGNLGTALTSAQSRQLLRFSENKNILICYDADAAGKKAAERSTEILAEVARGLQVGIKMVTIPGHKDPDAFLQAEGAPAFQQVIDQAQPLIEYLLDHTLKRFDLSQSVSKADAVKACLPILNRIEDVVYRDECLRKVANRAGVSDILVREQMARPMSKSRPMQRPSGAGSLELLSRKQQDKMYQSEMGLLYLMIEFPGMRQDIQHELAHIPFTDEVHEQLRMLLISQEPPEKNLTWSELFDYFDEPILHRKISEMMQQHFLKEGDVQKSLADFIRNVKLKCLNMQIEDLKRRITVPEIAGDAQHSQALMQEYLTLVRAQTKLKEACL